MTEKRFPTKAIVAFLMAILLFGSCSVFSFAADKVQNLKEQYGLIVPTDSNLKAQKSSYTFYGDSGKLYFMRISKGKKNAKFAVEIYSDSSYQNQIRSFSDSFSTKAGNKPFLINWNFKDIKSGKYYGRCYTYVEDENEQKTIDSSSFKKFTITINRVGKKTVKINSVANSVNGPVIKWSTLATGEKYYIYRKDSAKGSWKRLDTLGENKTSFTDKTAKSGKTYYYTVKCFDGKYNSLYNKNGVAIVCLSTPKLNKMQGTGSAGNAKVSWSKVTGAKGYYVYRKGGSLSDYTYERIATIKSGSTTSYTDTKARSSDWNYTYTVKAYNGKYTSGHNTTGVDFDYMAAPKLTKATSYYGGVKIEWSSSNENIVKYTVYRKSGSSWKSIGTTRNKYFIDTTAKSNTTYTYTVKGHSDTNSGAYNSKGISRKFIATPKLSAVTFNSKGQSVVKWSKVTGASGYKVYRKINDASSWTLIKTVKGGSVTSLTDSVKKTSGDRYTYTVRAYDSKNALGYFTLNGVTGIYLSKPSYTAQQIPTQDGTLAIELKWNAVKGAEGYNLYRRIPGQNWIYLEKAYDGVSYIDSTVENGQIYDYAVRAVTSRGDISLYDTKSAYALKIPTMESVIVEDSQVKLTWSVSEGATAYNVYRMPKNGNTWTFIGSSEATEFADTSPESVNEHFYYQVSAVVGKLESGRNEGLPNFVMLNAAGEFDPETNVIKLNWEASDNAVVSAVKALGDEPAISFFENYASSGILNDNLIIEGESYSYTLTAAAQGKVSSIVSLTVKYPHPPLKAADITSAKLEYTESGANCTIAWNGVEFADKYIVLRAPVDGEYAEIATVAADTGIESKFICTDIDVPADGKYTYIIKAVATQSERDASLSESSDLIEVYKQLSALTDLTVSNSEINEQGAVSVTLSWAATENAEKYIIERTIASTGKTVILAELVPQVEIEGKEPILKTFFVDTSAQPDVRYHYRVTSVAENRGKVSSIIENYCWGSPKAFYADYNYEKIILENRLNTLNVDEDGKAIFENTAFEEVKLSYSLTAPLSTDLPESEQATVDAATQELKALNEKLQSNMLFTVTFMGEGDVILSQEDFVTGSLFETIVKPALPENTDTSVSLGWATSDNTLIVDSVVLTDNITLYPAHEVNKLLLKADSTISFDTDYIKGIELGSTVALLKTQLENDLTYIEIKDYTGKTLEDTALIGTGVTVSLVSKYTGNVYETKSVVILGEVTGDGIIDSADSNKIDQAAASCIDAYTFNGIYLHCFTLASDVNGDGVIDVMDTL